MIKFVRHNFEKLKMLGSVQTLPNAPKMSPIASERIRTRLNASKGVRTTAKMSENVKKFTKTSRKLRERQANYPDARVF